MGKRPQRDPGASKRHQRENGEKDPLDKIKIAQIRRIARKAGIKRLNRHVGLKSRVLLREYYTDIVRDATIYMQYFGNKRIHDFHVRLALDLNGRKLYGI